MSRLSRGKARSRITNPHIQRLAQQNRRENMTVMATLSARFAHLINSVADLESRAIAEQALSATHAGVEVALKHMIKALKAEYASNWASPHSFGSGPVVDRMQGILKKHPGENVNWGSRLSPDWVTQKAKWLNRHGVDLPNDGAPFHGFGHYGVPLPSRTNRRPEPLKVWASGLNLTTDVMNLYRLMGMAKLQIAGNLATKKGYTQTETGFVDAKGKRATLKDALRRAKPHQVQGQGLVVTFHKTHGLSAYVKGRRVSLLELNHAGLIGSKLELVALGNMFSGPNAPKNRGYRFFEHAQKYAGGRYDIFGKSAGTKLHFSARRNRDPIGNYLEVIIEEFIPLAIYLELKKRKLV
ncbi:hypothetical protein [Photobacterium sp. GSS17]|uniref:hypothetical protein n=1 Tax=Photobacterium sp. GSS17 TaxID=3020715 RepID=UPI00235EE2EF|nr:hypothetical protein [Photobacterium sp. GSS17]